EHICESLELFGREVLPAFKERDDAQVAAKQRRLAPAIDAAMQRRSEQPPPPQLPPSYTFPAIPRRWVDEHGSEEMKAWLERFATARASGTRDETLGILG
ncbi:MAG TPA: hypothetical protein VHE57_09105, partial [Mycobacteriales bacterium]|nr:hypothetical protein [Mycobacteriales bacterium]